MIEHRADPGEWLQRVLAVMALCWSLSVLVPWRDEVRLRLNAEDFRWEVSGHSSSGKRPSFVLPANSRVSLELTSSDYLYGLDVPGLDGSSWIAPKSPVELRLETDAGGRFELRGRPMCGGVPESLTLDLRVVSRAEYDLWSQDR